MPRRAKSTVDLASACKKHLDRLWKERKDTTGITDNYDNLIAGINAGLDAYAVDMNNLIPEPERTMYNKEQKADAMIDVVIERYLSEKEVA